MNTGVYIITNNVNGKRYVGSAAHSFNRRWLQHRRNLRGNRHPNRYLQAAWNKYGEAAFVFAVVARCEPARCLAVEQLFIDALGTASKSTGYNLAPKAGSVLGVKHSADARAAMSAAAKRRKASPETRAKMSESNKGKKRSPASRLRLKAAALLRGISPEQREKMNAGKRANRWHHSPESLAKMSAGNKGRKLTLEHREKMSLARKGKPLSPEHRAALRKPKRRKIVRSVGQKLLFQEV